MNTTLIKCESELNYLLAKHQKTIDDCLAISELAKFINQNRKEDFNHGRNKRINLMEDKND